MLKIFESVLNLGEYCKTSKTYIAYSKILKKEGNRLKQKVCSPKSFRIPAMKFKNKLLKLFIATKYMASKVKINDDIFKLDNKVFNVTSLEDEYKEVKNKTKRNQKSKKL